MKKQYRVEIPKQVKYEDLLEWCKKHLNGQVRLTYHRKECPTKKKWVRDYSRQPLLRFKDDDDAMAFKLRWTQ